MENTVVIESTRNGVFIFTAIVFAVAMLWESFSPRRELGSGMLWRWLNNFSLGALSWYINAVMGTWFLLWISQQTAVGDYRLLRHWGAGNVIGFFTLLTVTQFISYWAHVVFHKVAWLWPIHAVHHSDVEIDVSTSYRHHPLEPLITLPIAGPIVLLLGIPAPAIIAYRMFEVAASVFSHSNIRIPQAIEKYLRFVVLTPDYHRIHHCSEPQFTNSNYGSLIPWFDYLFGTNRNRPYDDQEDMQLGLEYLREPRDSRLDKLLATPLYVRRAIREIQHKTHQR